MGNYHKVKYLELNETDSYKVKALAANILANGWKGAPILFVEGTGLVTGSHRVAALRMLEERYEETFENAISAVLNADIALDVSNIVNAYCEKNEMSWEEIDFSSIGDIFDGTEVEQYKTEIAEW
ncbi:hypothetical protein [Paenibacillus sp. IHBB 3054]|uniref:hypothetical protein n=1 Tax=Paenibacillus sp. IHBB 3054 TaxID=3425689 RepID=UPI003F66C145